MSASCCHDCHDDDPQRGNAAYRRILWIVLAVNAAMFVVDIVVRERHAFGRFSFLPFSQGMIEID